MGCASIGEENESTVFTYCLMSEACGAFRPRKARLGNHILCIPVMPRRSNEKTADSVVGTHPFCKMRRLGDRLLAVTRWIKRKGPKAMLDIPAMTMAGRDYPVICR